MYRSDSNNLKTSPGISLTGTDSSCIKYIESGAAFLEICFSFAICNSNKYLLFFMKELVKSKINFQDSSSLLTMVE